MTISSEIIGEIAFNAMVYLFAKQRYQRYSNNEGGKERAKKRQTTWRNKGWDATVVADWDGIWVTRGSRKGNISEPFL